jgi:glutamate dehydrogenase (NAD(P)+)
VVDVALHYCDFELEGARVVIQGFGAVGRHAAHFLTARGARLVAVADSGGAIHNPDGLDINALLELKAAGRSVADYPNGSRLEKDGVIDVECDIWIPAARPDVVNENNVHRLRTRLVVEGANIPFTLGAEEYLHERGVICIPDFIANAGGVICAAMEYHGATQAAALQTIEEKLRRNTEQVMETAKSKLILPRQAAIEMAEQRVRRAMSLRRYSLFSTAPDYT